MRNGTLKSRLAADGKMIEALAFEPSTSRSFIVWQIVKQGNVSLQREALKRNLLAFIYSGHELTGKGYKGWLNLYGERV